MKEYYIIDTTLRDGEQTAGVTFSKTEKMEIARMLSDAGIDIIEVGIPAMGEEELDVIRSISGMNLKSKILTWNRIVKDDITKSICCGVKNVHISSPVSDIHIYKKLNKNRDWVIDKMRECVSYAVSEGCEVSVGGEDATRANLDFLIKYYETARDSGAARIRYADTLGALDPISTYEKIKKIREETGIDIDFHGHNDFGMATGNSISAYRAGAKYISASINGLGERAGNTALEEVCASMKYIIGSGKKIDLKKIVKLSEYVEHASGKMIHDYKPIVGKSVFTHESGLHVDGILKDKSTYEMFSPEDIGRKRKLVVGKYSGSAAIINKFHELGYNIDKEQANDIVRLIRKRYEEDKNFSAEDVVEEFKQLLDKMK